jgi:hypothetical protein
VKLLTRAEAVLHWSSLAVSVFALILYLLLIYEPVWVVQHLRWFTW